MDTQINLADKAMGKAQRKLVPFIVLMYIFAFLDRSNIGFAKEAFQLSTGISEAAFALGAGIFFIGYAVFEVPSNILMHKFGARLWLSRIMITWGLVSAGFALVTNEFQFLVLRVLLGIAEAGFMPAIVYYFTLWFTEERRSSIMGLFWMGPPLAFIFGSPISGLLLDMHGFLGHEGWQWMFAIEGLLAAVSGVFAFRYVSAIPWIFALVATIYLPRLSDKTGMRGSLAAVIIALSGIGYFVSSTSFPILGIAALSIVAIGNLACQPIFWTLPSRILTGIGAASGIAFINSMGNLGGFVAPNLRVWAETVFQSSNAGLYAMGISGFIAAILLFLTIPMKMGNNLKEKN